MIAALIGICGCLFVTDSDTPAIKAWMQRKGYENIHVIRERVPEKDLKGFRQYIAKGTDPKECDTEHVFRFKHFVFFTIENITIPDPNSDE